MYGVIWVSVPRFCLPFLWFGGWILDAAWFLYRIRYGIAYMTLATMCIMAVCYSLTILYGYLT